MGAIADAFANYAQPLLDDTDGSMGQMNKAMSIAQFCWNLALASEPEKENLLLAMRETLGMEESEFEDFRSSIIEPMIKRHYQLFPNLPRRGEKREPSPRPQTQRVPKPVVSPSPIPKKSGKVGRNDPCPCNSGKKYKKCCGR